jgi:septal ring factor EnvC (AmiA/AmiB activator)
MSSSIPDPGLPEDDVRSTPSPASVGASISTRIQAVQSVSETAAKQAAQLVRHARQLQASLDQLEGKIGSVPGTGFVSILAEQANSLQIMLDWLATCDKATPARSSRFSGGPANLSEFQTRLSVSRVALVDLKSATQQAAALAQRLAETRAKAASLAEDVEALGSVQETAETIAGDARELAAREEQTPDDSTHVDEPSGEVLAGQQAEEAAPGVQPLPVGSAIESDREPIASGLSIPEDGQVVPVSD